MSQEIKSLTEAKHQREEAIKMYKEFLKDKAQNFEAKYGT